LVDDAHRRVCDRAAYGGHSAAGRGGHETSAGAPRTDARGRRRPKKDIAVIIPEGPLELQNFLRNVVDICTQSQQERRSLYDKRRRYYLYGQNQMQIVRFNRLKSHMPLLTSFLYAADQIAYTVAAPKNDEETTVAQYLAIEDDWNQTFQDSGLADDFDQALVWATIYDTMIIKQGWNDITDTPFAQLIEPSSFGVYREDIGKFDSQQAMVHSFALDYDDAVERMVRAGRAGELDRLQPVGGGGDTAFPGMLNQLIVSATGGANVMGNVQGEINPSYEAGPAYAARVSADVVMFQEVWVWDTKAGDWRIFHLINPDIVLSDSKKTIADIRNLTPGAVKRAPKYDSDTNLFLRHETPFTPVTPYPIYNYFWGDCHLEDLIPLQNWSTERLEQIDELLEKQVDPAKSFAGFMGIDDERAAAFGGPGTQLYDQAPGAKVEIHDPKLPPDLFHEFDQIGALFMEQSGFTEIMAGRGEKNVRGRSHARELKTTGGGRIRKVASGLEKPLSRIGDIGLRLKARNDDDPLVAEIGGKKVEFVIAQALEASKYEIRVAGHSHSPLFTAETSELAQILFKAQAIDQEWLIRSLRPPREANLLHALRRRRDAQAKLAKERQAQGLPPQGQQPRSHHKQG
jgi:hypothetical protein